MRGFARYVVLGCAFVAVVVALLLSRGWAGMRAGQSSDEVLAHLHEHMPSTSVEAPKTTLPSDSNSMPALDVGGNAYIGSLAIPSLDLDLPIAATCTDELLRISPCRFEGSYVTNDIVICGEGYARHFGSIGSLGIRDEVRLQTVDGVLYRYVVSNVETDRMEDITAIMDDWDLTLFTFNADGSCCVVRCVRVT